MDFDDIMDFDDNDDNLFTVEIEWTIENFSCWDAEAHGNVIDSPDIPSLPDFKVSLQHQRTPMIDAPMTISCFFGKHRPWDGEVTFLGADQSILGTEKIRAMERDRVTVPAPDLSSAAEELEEEHGDSVTLRFRFAAPDREYILCRLNTTITVLSDVSTKFSRSELLNDIAALERKLLMTIVYNSTDNEQVEVHLERVLYRTPSGMLPIIYLELRPSSNFASQNVVVKCCTDMFDAGTLLRSDSFCRDFKTTNNLGLEPWPIAHSLTQDLLSGRDCFVHLRIRFVTGTIEGHERTSVVSSYNISSEEVSPRKRQPI